MKNWTKKIKGGKEDPTMEWCLGILMKDYIKILPYGNCSDVKFLRKRK